MSTPDKNRILQQIAEISTMERGKLSSYSFKNRPKGGIYHKLQRWENGENQTSHVTAEELPALEAALAGYGRYEQLTAEYADLVIAETRQNNGISKKKNSRRISSSLRKRKSNL